VPNHLLSSIHEARAAGRPHQLLTLAVSAWCRYLRRVDEQGQRLPLEDPRAEHLERLAARGGDDPRELLSDAAMFGALGACPRFTDGVRRDLRDADAMGLRAVIAARTGGARLAAAS